MLQLYSSDSVLHFHKFRMLRALDKWVYFCCFALSKICIPAQHDWYTCKDVAVMRRVRWRGYGRWGGWPCKQQRSLWQHETNSNQGASWNRRGPPLYRHSLTHGFKHNLHTCTHVHTQCFWNLWRQLTRWSDLVGIKSIAWETWTT